MSSGFVSGGSLDAPIERDEAWAKAEAELDEARKRKADLAKQQASGKSLFETLQANKAAKQDAFEESIRLKNQFRALDDDEADFLDTVLESQRAKELAVKKDTAEQLAAFRKLRDDADRGVAGVGPVMEGAAVPAVAEVEGLDWAVAGRKRKAGEKEVLRGLKVRRTAGKAGRKRANVEPTTEAEKKDPVAPSKQDEAELPKAPAKGGLKAPPQPGKASLGLAGYSSDDEEE